MLFAPGKRPTRAAILRFVSQQHAVALSHDPAEQKDGKFLVSQGGPASAAAGGLGTSEAVWLELLRDGLTYDVKGLAPGPAGKSPQIIHRFDFAEQPDEAGFEVIGITPGPHLSGGERSIPVLRGMLALARDLTQHFEDARAVFWQPSASAIGRRFFESIVTAWLEGGAFPALGLTAFEETAEGALQSVGLGFWIGQELRIEAPLSADKVAATRLGVRLVNQLVMVGGIDESERIVAPDGTRLVMQASRNSQFIRVRRE
ncbi:hypothetical protein I603_1264 [Erythrobacter dokdonensis DSW-74]|uniref:Uncharacterized protein n=1 Tax=Erythrobacter dokdonensis DSW-74 TaxID=1300349 RepID=A0A1A7BJD3_9SPHN|nr:hypothetical protein I603_1264 [Erythrobacter dokdonensis DSW-74]